MADIIVEERGRGEIASLFGRTTVPDAVPVVNYAFDGTPFSLITAIITEEGLIRHPFDHPWLMP